MMARGISYEQARTEACKAVVYPGTSERNSGLAVDIVSLNYQILDNVQANTPENNWLLAHCAEYGFILRYPLNKSDLTGIMYEPWHFRYVGIEAARIIMKSGILRDCLTPLYAYKTSHYAYIYMPVKKSGNIEVSQGHRIFLADMPSTFT